MKNKILQIIVAVILVAFLVLLANPFTFWMPEVALMLTLLVATALLIIWIGLVLQEKAGDEREEAHRMEAGRTAYIYGVGVLTLALIYQGLNHTLDPWILVTLGVMVLSRLISRLYADIHR